MNEQGFISVYALWIFLALISLSAAVLAVARWHRVAAQARAVETRSFFIAHSAALLAFQSNFTQESLAFDFEGGRVSLERLNFVPDEKVSIRCAVHIGRYHRESDVEWKKNGGHWKAVTWREL